MLTAKNVTSLPAPEQGQKDYPDPGLPGFSLRVSASGRRVYTLYYRVRDSVKKRRATLGSASQISLADARQRARELLRDISLGSTPWPFTRWTSSPCCAGASRWSSAPRPTD